MSLYKQIPCRSNQCVSHKLKVRPTLSGARKYYEFWVAAVQADPGNENSQFVWDRSRIPILGSMWLPNQPSDSGQNEDHAEVMLGRRGRPGLNDDTGSKSQKYLCETAKC